MSRRVNIPVIVHCNHRGEPVAVTIGRTATPLPVLERCSHWREWFGILEGEPQRDVWKVHLPNGICELHCLRHPLAEHASPGEWILHRWED